jgi:cytochrome c-type biogenesis protein CcmH
MNPHAEMAQKQAPTAEELVTLLEDRTSANPEDPDAWFMLGRMYATTGRYNDAVTAYEKLVKITDNHPTALVVLADALAMSQEGKIAGRPMQLVQQALEIDPQNTTALWLAGRGAAEMQQYADSMQYFERAAAQLSDKPELLAQLKEQMQEVRAAAQSGGVDLPAVELPTTTPGVTVQVAVSLDPALQDDIAATDTLFIFARAAEGPPMPIAAVKRQAGDLPLSITLDDTAILRPGSKLSQFGELKLAARITKSGQPVASSGDLQSKPVSLRPGSDSTVSLVIDQRVP